MDKPAGDGQGHRLAVIMVNFASSDLIRANHVPGLATSDKLKVFLVDNFSSEAEGRSARELCSEQDWQFLPLHANEGFGAGANHGAWEAIRHGYDSLVFLNPDTLIERATLLELAVASQADPLSMVTPVVVRPDGTIWHRGARFDQRSGDMVPLGDVSLADLTTWISGACLAVGARLWGELGGFEDEYFLYWEDVDLSRRCHALGGRIAVRRDLCCVHSVGGTQGTDGKSAQYYYFNCRNRLVFARRNLPAGDRRRWVMHTPCATWHILRREGRRRLITHPELIWAGVRGSVSGLRSMWRAVDRGQHVRAGARV